MDPIFLSEEIRKTHEEFISHISELTNEELNTIPFAGSWTAGQVADHILKSTDGVPDNRTEQVSRPPDQQVEAIKTTFLDFTIKFQSPEFVIPAPGPFETDVIIAELERIKRQNVAIALTKDLSGLCTEFDFPGFGHLTRYEWLKFIVFHTQRHIHQLKQIKNALVNQSHAGAIK
jgi:hypothetical protein